MDQIFFSLKRGHHTALRRSRTFLKRIPLTPARFDLLFAMAQGSVGRPGITAVQSQLRKVLGVSRTTVSRMLQSLEKLGLLSRGPAPHDKRQRLVKLTREGIAWFRVAKRATLLPAALDVEATLAPGYHTPGPRLAAWNTATAGAVARFRGALDNWRRQMRDTASLVYPSLVRDPDNSFG